MNTIADIIVAPPPPPPGGLPPGGVADGAGASWIFWIVAAVALLALWRMAARKQSGK